MQFKFQSFIIHCQSSKEFHPLLGIIVEQLIFPTESGILVVPKNRHYASSFSTVESSILVFARNHH